MSIATRVLNTASQLEWLEIEDNDGGITRYNKRGPAPHAAELHVDFDFIPPSVYRAKLVRDQNGEGILRQDDPGLPDKAIVNYIDMVGVVGAPLPGGWGEPKKFEYAK